MCRVPSGPGGSHGRARVSRHGSDRGNRSVLNEKDGDVVPHQIPVPLLRVEAHCKAADVAGRVAEPRDPATVENRTKRSSIEASVKTEAQEASQSFGEAKRAMGARPPGMYHAARDALVVEVHDLFAAGGSRRAAWARARLRRRLLSVSSTGTPSPWSGVSPPWAHWELTRPLRRTP